MRWRFPIMFQSFFTLLVMWGIMVRSHELVEAISCANKRF